MTRRSDSPEEIPAGPVGVWLEYGDGLRYTDVPTIYVGRDDEGLAVFEVIPPREGSPVAAGMATMPGMTTVSIPALRPKEHHGEEDPHQPQRDQ
jgi:hypothetical protein